MKYDCLIIGAGVIGASIARELSKYQLKVIVLEKENDVCEETSCANSAIIHSGYDPEPGTLKAILNVKGNAMYDQLSKDLDVPFVRNGSITLAIDEEQVKVLDTLMDRAKQNGVPATLLDPAELAKADPTINKKALKGLLAPTAGLINPFELNVALMENAMDNGVELSLCDEVKAIKRVNDGFMVTSEKGVYETNYVINASGIYASFINEMVNPASFQIKPRKGEYFVIDHYDDSYLSHTLFGLPSSKGKGVLVAPTTHHNYIVGPSSEFVDDYEDTSTDAPTLASVKQSAYNLVDYVDYSKQIRQFAGLRAVSSTSDFVIEETSPKFINVAGIQSPGLTAAPAIAQMVVEMIKDKTPNPSFNPKRRPIIRVKELSIEERNALIKKNPKYGRIICRCEQITEGEVIDCIHRNCGATTIKGVKKRVRPGFGKCQGGFCESLVMEILCRELGLDPLDIRYGKRGSYILDYELKGGTSND